MISRKYQTLDRKWEKKSAVVQIIQKVYEIFGIIVYFGIVKSMIKCILQEIFIKIVKEEVLF